MQGNKIALNLRKVHKKQYNPRFHIKTQKIAAFIPEKKQQVKDDLKNRRKSFKIRQAQVVSKKKSAKNSQPHEARKSAMSKQTKNDKNKFPEIYNPAASSAKYFENKKYDSKNKMNSTNFVVEKFKSQSEHLTQIPERSSYRKTQLDSAHRSLKLTQIEPVRQMSKQKKIELFKAIRSQFNVLINTTNNLSVRNQDTCFRAFVELGNNGLLVKQILKKRWWWYLEQDKSKANLIWTNWFDRNAISNLSSISCYDETADFGQYQTSNTQFQDKSQAIRRLVDYSTFSQLQNKINFSSNTYFKAPKGGISQSLKNLQPNCKIITVDNKQIIHNHVEGCLNLHSKKLLFKNFHYFMMQKGQDPFSYIPLTFYVQSRDSPVISDILSQFSQIEQQKSSNKTIKNIWICKPGENSNRGIGIKVVKSKQQILSQINSRLGDDNLGNRTVIIQKYIQKCFLINNRKFDIRCYILLTTANGILKGYWYKDGYIRTSSIQYNLDDTDNQMIHLTNDAVQKKGEDFGKHQDSNKLGFQYFRQYLRKVGQSPYKFDQSYEKMKQTAYYLIASVSTKIKRKQFTFELFGLDFMLDENLNPILIQANSNPCLSNHGKILGNLIHELVQNVFMTAIDPIFPPPSSQEKNKNSQQIYKDYFKTNKFQLIFTGRKNNNQRIFQNVTLLRQTKQKQ